MPPRESANLGQPEVKIGIISDRSGAQRLARAVGMYQAMRYVLTADIFGAGEAYDVGPVGKLVPEAEKRAVDVAKQVAELPPLAIEQAQEAVLRRMDAALDTGLALEAEAIQLLLSSQDQEDGMAAFIDKRETRFIGK